MSAPMVLGADVPSVYRWVLKALHSVRGYRAPLFVALPHLDPGTLRAIVVESVACLGLSELTLGRVALALTALENYFTAIGSRWDARRMRDMRWPVDELLRHADREHEQAARWAHASQWEGAFRSALGARSGPVRGTEQKR